MNVAVFSFSPKNESSLTYHSALYLKTAMKEDNFDIRLVGGHCQCSEEDGEALKKADLVLFISSIFHFSVPHQMMLYMDDMLKKYGDVMAEKVFSFYSTSGKIMDITIHGYVENFFKNHNLKYLRFLSQFDASLLSTEGQKELLRWYRFLYDSINSPADVKFKDDICKVVICDVTDGTNEMLLKAADASEKEFTKRGASVKRVNLRDYKMIGCTACYGCYTTCVCVLNKTDQWADAFRDVMDGTDIIQFVGKLENGMMGPLHKVWLDRQVQFGRRPFYREKIFDMLLDTTDSTADDLNMLKIHTDAMDDFGGDVTCKIGPADDYEAHAREAVILYNNEVTHACNFYGVGVDMKFARLAVEIQKLSPADYEYFTKRGAYKPMELNPNIAPVYSPEDAIRTKKGRLTPYRAVILDAEKSLPDITVRERSNGPMPQMEYTPPKKKKLFGR